MIQPYFQVFYSLLAWQSFRTLEIHHGYQLVLLATSKLMGDNMEFDNLAIF